MHSSDFARHDAAAWAVAREALLPACHPVDRDAVRIWCQFYPLPLTQALAESGDRDALTRTLRLRGDYDLAAQIDTSHWFLYGHRFWSAVKVAIVAFGQQPADNEATLVDAVRQIARSVATVTGADESLTIGISFVGLMTLRQVGSDAFQRGSGATANAALLPGTPDAIVAARAKDDGQGVLGLLRGAQSAKFSVVFDERRRDGRFPLISDQHLTTAAALDTRDYKTTTGVRSSHEGPIPCDCRSASCGTCWIGVLGGAEKLSDVEPLEQRRLIEFGYLQTAEPRPVIRLACMARASGNVTVVIPTWHGRIGVAGLGTV